MRNEVGEMRDVFEGVTEIAGEDFGFGIDLQSHGRKLREGVPGIRAGEVLLQGVIAAVRLRAGRPQFQRRADASRHGSHQFSNNKRNFRNK